MRRWIYTFLLISMLCGCMPVDPFIPIPPVPPPIPPTPTPPEPSAIVSRTIFDTLQIGDSVDELGGLPTPDRIVRADGGKEIWVWTLDEERPDGGWIRYEVHVVDGKITALLDW